MADIRILLDRLAAAEGALREISFVAPCVRGGRVRAKVGGLVQTFQPDPRDFEGWGVFAPADASVARLVEEASLPAISGYLEMLPTIRLRLAWAMDRRTWLAYPASEGDAAQRLGAARPMPVHLVEEGSLFEQVVARWDGRALWHEDMDRRDDPMHAERLRAMLDAATPADEVAFPGLTPEMRMAYGLAAQRAAQFSAARQLEHDRGRLEKALGLAGGALLDFRERHGLWQVEWRTRDGERHTSAISRRDLTVISSGVCLSGRDRDFDLQSLVGVIERRPEDW